MKGHEAVLDTDSHPEEPTCAICGDHLDMVFVHFEERRCECAGPGQWHCYGEESQHWAKGDEDDAECGHCGETGVQLP